MNIKDIEEARHLKWVIDTVDGYLLQDKGKDPLFRICPDDRQYGFTLPLSEVRPFLIEQRGKAFQRLVELGVET